MRQLLVVGEDALSCALGQQVVKEVLPRWALSGLVDTRGVTKLRASISRYVQQSLHVQPVLCFADTDGACPVTMRAEWLPNGLPEQFLLRFAVTESESWILADRDASAEFFGISLANIPRNPDSVQDPKREVLRLAHMSKIRTLRTEMVSQNDINKKGAGYNAHLCAFVASRWNAKRAAVLSPSLTRAIEQVAKLDAAR